jgi:ribosomal protein S2
MFTDAFIYDRCVNYFKKFNYLGGMITNDARYKCEIKSRTTMEKLFNKKETHFTIKLDSNLRKELMKCDTWNTALYGTGNGTLRYIDQKYI